MDNTQKKTKRATHRCAALSEKSPLIQNKVLLLSLPGIDSCLHY